MISMLVYRVIDPGWSHSPGNTNNGVYGQKVIRRLRKLGFETKFRKKKLSTWVVKYLIFEDHKGCNRGCE